MTRRDPGWVPLHVAVRELKKEGVLMSPWYLLKWMRDVEVRNLRAGVPYVRERDVPRIREMCDAHVVERALMPRVERFNFYEQARNVRDSWFGLSPEIKSWKERG